MNGAKLLRQVALALQGRSAKALDYLISHEPNMQRREASVALLLRLVSKNDYKFDNLQHAINGIVVPNSNN